MFLFLGGALVGCLCYCFGFCTAALFTRSKDIELFTKDNLTEAETKSTPDSENTSPGDLN